ncbi:FAD-dependent thymidylate synthase [Candidatus Woesearchaeota archaeon]|nr:FAD-dependent thymidylate synthase [Candidatus Woesearchaeota archaeon]
MGKEGFTDKEKEILLKHVTNIDNNIYCVKNLPEEVVAVLFAYYSRSENKFRTNLLKTLGSGDIDVKGVRDLYGAEEGYSEAKEKAMKFHNKWVVGYGHASVAEHADLKYALEDVSNVFTKIIEDNRLGRFTEKSSRYVIFDTNHFYKPKKIMDSKYKDRFLNATHKLFGLYEELQAPMFEFIKKKVPQEEGVSDRAYEASVKAKVCDVLRYLLPASTLTCLGCSLNARAAAHAIKKLLSHPLEEAQEIGKQMLEEGKKICPTLLEYADYNKYLAETPPSMHRVTDKVLESIPKSPTENCVVLVDWDKDAENKLIAAILYKYSHHSYDQLIALARLLSKEVKENILDEYLRRIDRFDYPLRELEHVYLTTDMIMDLGAFRDVQRHRVCTQTVQLNTCDHGYETPPDLIAAGFEDRFQDAMKTAKEAYDAIAKEFPYEAQYVVPYAFKKRMLFTWNLRELEHFIRLRSSPQGHISYRRIAIRCHEELEKKFPLLAKYLRVNKENYELGRLKAEMATDEKLKRLKDAESQKTGS